MSRYACDFETTTDPADCRVWAFACCDIDTVYDCEDVVFGNTIDGFMKWLELCDKPRVWFHNLKFDGEFILNWLFDNGWEWVDDRRDLDALKFTTLISDMGQWYSIELEFANGTRARIQDSLKVVTMPVADIPKAFGLGDAKLELDYKGKREVGHELTEEERAYVREDVVIVAKALHQMFEQGATKMTAGANALAAYKKSVGGGKRFRKIFPVPDYDAEVRRAYRGGFTYADPRFAGRDAGPGISFDVNSLYPAVMRFDPLPYGDPERFSGKPEPDARRPLYIVSVMVDAVLKPGHIPCIQESHGFCVKITFYNYFFLCFLRLSQYFGDCRIYSSRCGCENSNIAPSHNCLPAHCIINRDNRHRE